MEQNALPIDQAQIDSLIRAGEMTQHQLGELEKRVTGLEGRQVADNAAIPAIYTINQAGEIVNSNVTELSALTPVKGKFLKVNAATGKLEWAEAGGTTLPPKVKGKFLRVGTALEEPLEWASAGRMSAGATAIELAWEKEGFVSKAVEVEHTLGVQPTAVIFTILEQAGLPEAAVFNIILASRSATKIKFFARSSVKLPAESGFGVLWAAMVAA